MSSPSRPDAERRLFEVEDAEESGDFCLTSTPSDVHHQFVKEVIDRTVTKRRRKQPHQCVTVKLPYQDYARVTRVREGGSSTRPT